MGMPAPMFINIPVDVQCEPLLACTRAAFSHMPTRAQIQMLCLQIAEIGATAKAPAERTMKRGIGMGYAIILTAYLTVSITGRHTTSGIPCWCMCGMLALENGYCKRVRLQQVAPCENNARGTCSQWSLYVCRLLGVWNWCLIK